MRARSYINVVCTLCALLCVDAAFGQGALIFYNRGLRGPQFPGIYDAPVSLPDGRLVAGPEFTAGLFLVGENGSLNMVATSPFRSGVAAGFFFPQEVLVPGTTPGLPATFRVRVWETVAGSYENAISSSRLYGEFPTMNPDNHIIIPSMVPPGAPLGLPSLDGMLPFTLVPEPSALSIFVAASILVYVGKRSSIPGDHERNEVPG